MKYFVCHQLLTLTNLRKTLLVRKESCGDVHKLRNGFGGGRGLKEMLRFVTMGRGGVLRCVTYYFGYCKCHQAVKNQHIK